MNLRIARKILKAVGTPDERRYNSFQIGKANDRYNKTRSAKEDERNYRHLMNLLGVRGRVEVLRRKAPQLAFQVLMDNPEESW